MAMVVHMVMEAETAEMYKWLLLGTPTDTVCSSSDTPGKLHPSENFVLAGTNVGICPSPSRDATQDASSPHSAVPFNTSVPQRGVEKHNRTVPHSSPLLSLLVSNGNSQCNNCHFAAYEVPARTNCPIFQIPSPLAQARRQKAVAFHFND
ncbi:hypothetical protein SODALDRAFT_359242 [Sodiomyces alkalinus F11]|uniref:Uncharacterized protein n=1 Tax=Sodiomyces alkalinus (strain CBS 110278 / VKM F-3762 / F11) TaxID=1314773 RepID=A0A3N2PYD0_SODAK|nr:hypothetical protein SODALDRAFT_359242 [Sodiomyces alkalinus F11]ROT39355.1 hypothetical protein SODALDRAFT_359242 [Sodiomyces alkalinus F11]